MRGELFAEVLEGSPDWIDQEWERMEAENPTQTIGPIRKTHASLNGCSEEEAVYRVNQVYERILERMLRPNECEKK